MKTQSLTIYLLKEHISEPVYIFKPDLAVTVHPIVVDEQTTYQLFAKKIPPAFPKWTELFKNYVDRSIFGETRPTAAVLLVPIDNRIMALTFGQGRHMLADDCWEERFGLRVVLNSIGEGRLRSIDKHTFDAIPKHSREQTSRDASPYDFALDIEKDLLRAVTGALDDKTLGSMLTGMDALRTHVEVNLEGIEAPLRLYAGKFQDTAYKENFPWADHISDVRSKETIEILDLLLMDRLSARDFDRCWLAAPDLIDWASVRGFKYGKGYTLPEYNDIHLGIFLDSLRRPVTREDLSDKKIVCIGDDDREIDSWPSYRCLYCEIDHGDESYLLSGGKWYQVARNFVDEVNLSFARIGRVDLAWPEYDDDSEGRYLKRIHCARRDYFALMDQKFIYHGPMRSKVEFCDLFTAGNDLIHVKRYGNAGVLSHLFAQGLVSGDLLHIDREFREKVREKLPPSHREQVPVDRPSPEDYRVIFAIVSQSDKPLSLPFFSRLSLRHAARRLEGVGYKVALAKIGVGGYRRKRLLGKEPRRSHRSRGV